METAQRVDNKHTKSPDHPVKHRAVWRVIWFLVILALIGSGVYFFYRFSQYGKEKATNLVAEGQTFERDYHLTEALKNYETALALSSVAKPQAAEAAFRAAAIYTTKQQFDLAEQYLERATQLEAGNAQYFLALGQAELSQRKLEEADSNLVIAASLDPSDASILAAQARLHIAKEDSKEAARLVGDALKKDRKNPDALFLDAALNLHDKPATAEKNLETLIPLTQDKELIAKANALASVVDQVLNKIANPSYEFALAAGSLLDHDEPDLALLEARQAVEEDDEYRDAWLMQGRAELATDRLEDAQRSLDKAATLDPTAGQVAFAQGVLAVKQNDSQQAVEALKKAIDLGYKNVDVYVLLAEQEVALGQIDAAGKALSAGLEAHAANRDLLLAIFWLNFDNGNGKDVKNAAEDFEDAFPDEPMADALLGLADIKLEKNQTAAKHANEALDVDPLLAAAHLALGLSDDNRDELVRAIDLDWQGDVARVARAALDNLDAIQR